jgi:hypothetical protein
MGRGRGNGKSEKRESEKRKSEKTGSPQRHRGNRAERSGQVVKCSSERWEAVKAGVTSIDIAIT